MKLVLRRERVALGAVLEAAREVSQPLIAQRGQNLVVDGIDPTLMLDADAARLTQVFGNLLSNAAKFSRPGARIHLFRGSATATRR